MNLYEILGVSKDATKSEIKLAYRNLAKEHHPDKNNGNGKEKFQRITEAYRILSDDDLRREYDLTGNIPGYKKTAEERFKEEVNTKFAVVVNEYINRKFLDSPHTGNSLNLYEDLIDIVKGAKKAFARDIKKMKNSLEKLQVLVDRISEGLLHDIVNGQATRLRESIDRASHEVKVAEAILEILDHTEVIPPTETVDESLADIKSKIDELLEHLKP